MGTRDQRISHLQIYFSNAHDGWDRAKDKPGRQEFIPGLLCGWQETNSLSCHCCLLVPISKKLESGAPSANGIKALHVGYGWLTGWNNLLCKRALNLGKTNKRKGEGNPGGGTGFSFLPSVYISWFHSSQFKKKFIACFMYNEEAPAPSCVAFKLSVIFESLLSPLWKEFGSTLNPKSVVDATLDDGVSEQCLVLTYGIGMWMLPSLLWKLFFTWIRSFSQNYQDVCSR